MIINIETLAAVIKVSSQSPLFLNKTSDDFFSLETDFNKTVSRLNNEKDTLDKKVASESVSLSRMYRNKIADKEDAFRNGYYIPPVVAEVCKGWITSASWNNFLKIFCIGLGVLIILSGLFSPEFWFRIYDLLGSGEFASAVLEYKYYAGAILISAGVFIFHFLAKSFQKKVIYAQQFVSNRNNIQRELLDRLSGKMKEKLKTAEDLEKSILDQQVAEITEEKKKEEAQLNSQHAAELSRNAEKRKETMTALRAKTSAQLNNLSKALDSHLTALDHLPETFNPSVKGWEKNEIYKGKELVSSMLRIGHEILEVNIDGLHHSITIPKCIEFLNKSNLIINCSSAEETKEAIRISHNIIGRSLMALPPGKMKITFIDPLELGANAAPFTPLLREIYGGLVFTQSSDIENQLLLLTRVIENVIQKYLQDKFANIADYNLATKEVPEPYRLLVIYNFPHGFNDLTANKLLNIIKSGPKSGVHTILINDKNAKLPYGIDGRAFEGININEILLKPKRLPNRRFEFDPSLPFGNIVDYINKELPNVGSLKVPFTKYIAPQNEWWQEKSHKRYSVPIGRHALEVQSLKFDNDDDNQALLIGKPGSGKSNLLHVIIANSLWKYSPDQLEIYLIDFKGGVEFTIYADKNIPHIRTIAIESEREFGLSVLEGVEKELLAREKEFSKAGVQNIEQYHENFPSERMPRVLLIVDEFQEFFSEDDNIKQEVDDKFDRIIRKGRAFGINTLFSSQTLSGNSIKKSTKELIDIRIALMCSDLDSTQILDDRNPAARDLTRPGEGIYNSENGKVEGNKKFQAFFIEKSDLTGTIDSVVSFSHAKANGQSKLKQIIFRGSEKALLEKESHPLKEATPVLNPKSVRLWIGEPVAIAEDVTIIIRKQGGANLLVAGYDENIGLRIMCSSIISLALQQHPKSCKFYYFNFYNVDSDFVSVPHDLFNNLDQDSVGVSSRQTIEILYAVKEEIEKRHSGISENSSNIYLCFFSLQRGRPFRKEGYSMSEEGNVLGYILREGPDVGVFSLVQVDTMDNLSKNLDDNLLKEFSQRVVSQMNPDNSVKLIGSQKAAKLGANRALYYDDNENSLIKFKPYELPAFSWVAQLKKTQSILS